jgi:Protein of unknown function (DUF2905)
MLQFDLPFLCRTAIRARGLAGERPAVKSRRDCSSKRHLLFYLLRMQELGKTIVVIGVVLVIVGAILWKTGGLGGLGKLPGDIVIHRENSTFYFPLVTCLLLSVLLTVVMWLMRR